MVSIELRRQGVAPLLSAEAFELARQVYYLGHGSMRDCARAVIAAGLSDTSDVTKVSERLKNWWQRERWPKRPTQQTFVIRDANHDGGLYRGRLCAGVATGNGPAPAGKPCVQTALADSEYCYQHDPRPEYVEYRRLQSELLSRARAFDAVPIGPLQAWIDAERRRLLRDAGGEVHPNNRGWCLVAAKMGIDQSIVKRMMDGSHNGAAVRRGRPKDTIRASTAARYLDAAGVSFRDVYGFDPPPARGGDQKFVCPGCGGRKNHASITCRTCHEAEGQPCPYVNRRGETCGIATTHESGYCHKCRRIVERVPRPRTGRPSFVSVPMLILATGAYPSAPRCAWVARRMWACNAAGVADVFKSQKSLTSGLVKTFRKRGWLTVDQVRAAHEHLVAEHGRVDWPARGDVALEAAGLLPAGPFYVWLRERYAELGSYAQLAQRIHCSPDNLSKWIRGVDLQALVRRATVDRALEQWGDGTTFDDVYGAIA